MSQAGTGQPGLHRLQLMGCKATDRNGLPQAHRAKHGQIWRATWPPAHFRRCVRYRASGRACGLLAPFLAGCHDGPAPPSRKRTLVSTGHQGVSFQQDPGALIARDQEDMAGQSSQQCRHAEAGARRPIARTGVLGEEQRSRPQRIMLVGGA